AVDGKLLVGDYIKVKNRKIDGFIIGAMNADKSLSYIETSKNLCIITGGDRTEIALNAMETNIAMIVFTGNLYPDEKVLEKATKRNIPLILASGDTFTITQKLQNIHAEIQPADIEVCLQQVDQNIAWEEFTK
ncbi:MAG: hypothetical protein E4G98_06635, partial [Promethearchaeota archaeon]